jgi:hypothetical protein
VCSQESISLTDLLSVCAHLNVLLHPAVFHTYFSTNFFFHIFLSCHILRFSFLSFHALHFSRIYFSTRLDGYHKILVPSVLHYFNVLYSTALSVFYSVIHCSGLHYTVLLNRRILSFIMFYFTASIPLSAVTARPLYQRVDLHCSMLSRIQPLCCSYQLYSFQ